MHIDLIVIVIERYDCWHCLFISLCNLALCI